MNIEALHTTVSILTSEIDRLKGEIKACRRHRRSPEKLNLEARAARDALDGLLRFMDYNGVEHTPVEVPKVAPSKWEQPARKAKPEKPAEWRCIVDWNGDVMAKKGDFRLNALALAGNRLKVVGHEIVISMVMVDGCERWVTPFLPGEIYQLRRECLFAVGDVLAAQSKGDEK